MFRRGRARATRKGASRMLQDTCTWTLTNEKIGKPRNGSPISLHCPTFGVVYLGTGCSNILNSTGAGRNVPINKSGASIDVNNSCIPLVRLWAHPKFSGHNF